MSDVRPPIPEEVKRVVRQRCMFGCVFCGSPVYDYDHIIDWAEVQEHRPELITLLCPTHHSEKTRGLRTRDQVREADANPFNVQQGVTAPYGLNFGSETEATMNLGGNSFRSHSHLVPIVVDDQVIVGFLRNGAELGLYLDLVDHENIPKVLVRNNELLMRADAWDISFEGRRLTVRDGAGRVFLRMLFEPPASITIERARVLKNGAWAEVFPSRIELGGGTSKFTGNQWEGEVGFTIGYSPHYNPPSNMLRFTMPRFSPDALDRMQALPDDEAPETDSGA